MKEKKLKDEIARLREEVTRLREKLGITNASDNEDEKATPGKEGDSEIGKDSKVVVADSEMQGSNNIASKKKN